MHDFAFAFAFLGSCPLPDVDAAVADCRESKSVSEYPSRPRLVPNIVLRVISGGKVIETGCERGIPMASKRGS
jgi:hypothetical protein